jgi:23S rRNA pseudouridine2605 synthase
MPAGSAAAARPDGERIAKVIARAGVCSRRDAEKMIEAGRVAVDGQILRSAAVNVTATQRIAIDGKALPAREQTKLWRYHTPPGLVTSHRDPEGRPTVFQHLPAGLPRVVSVGRLDINSEGLLLLTNDGELARRLELPATGWKRRYRVRVHGTVDDAALARLAAGMTVDGVRYGSVTATLDRSQRDNSWLTMALTEGKNREVRRLCEHLGWQVSRLIRVAFGPFQLGDLEAGKVDEISGKVIADQLGRPAKGAKPHANRRRPA